MELDIRKFDYFYYSQNSLNSFERCPINFKLKYINGLNFKGDSAYEIEYYKGLEKGLDFHLLCERYFSGIEDFNDYGEISKWLESVKEKVSIKNGDKFYPEYIIKMKKDNLRLQAQYDLIVIRENKSIEIWDWKSEEKKLTYNKASKKYQTIVYMYVLFECMKKSFNIEVDYENITMKYYQPQFGDDTIDILYSKDKHQEFEEKLKEITYNIDNCDYEKDNSMLKNEKNCKYCEFKNICEEKVNPVK